VGVVNWACDIYSGRVVLKAYLCALPAGSGFVLVDDCDRASDLRWRFGL